jgi:hypothetical protein
MTKDMHISKSPEKSIYYFTKALTGKVSLEDISPLGLPVTPLQKTFQYRQQIKCLDVVLRIWGRRH